MVQARTLRLRKPRRGYRRFVCTSEKRGTGIFGARTGFRFYNSDSGRWLNRDPIGEMGGDNLYAFVDNAPVAFVDLLGLDICIIQSGSFPYHQWVVGKNPDGSYWDTDFGPASGGWGISCPGKVNFNEKSGFDDLKDLPDGATVVKCIVTSPGTDKKVKEEAKKRADAEKQPKYDLCGNSCWTYASELTWYARYLKMKKLIEEAEKKEKKQTPRTKFQAN
jgi:RHS repeat-associated protein